MTLRRTHLLVLFALASACRSSGNRDAAPLDAKKDPATVSTAGAPQTRYRAQYEFSQDWFSPRLPIREKYVLPLRNRPLH